jgi:hypothetical protein
MIAGFVFYTDAHYFFDASKVMIRGKTLTDDEFPGCLLASA